MGVCDLSVFRAEGKGRQDWKWLLHHSKTFFEFGLGQPPEIDTDYAITVFQCINHVPIRVILSIDDDGQGWPDIQCGLHVCLGFVYKLQLEMASVFKDNISPPPTYVCQLMPRPCTVSLLRYPPI